MPATKRHFLHSSAGRPTSRRPAVAVNCVVSEKRPKRGHSVSRLSQRLVSPSHDAAAVEMADNARAGLIRVN